VHGYSRLLTTGGTPPVVVSTLVVAGVPEPQEDGGLGQAQTVMV